ncbi:hypothetical protein EIP91_010586 [Steccherinum ochraceum]|uniref:ATP-grasp domain-containing protein n=1 Tax=Steccherinum ochraceum TaxID=92696 RepID=A0A4R0RIV8_9APHY|nr:hypothetical protein EIP91_010586 [Steccherinum ochraceum]
MPIPTKAAKRMDPAQPQRLPPPTYLQSFLASCILIFTSVVSLPFTLVLTLIALVWTAISSIGLRPSYPAWPNRKTVLVTGARSNKALTLIRALKRAGHRVIAAEEEEWGVLAPARFSRAVDKYYLLPDAPHNFEEDGKSSNAYIDAIKALVQSERVDAWIPCSSVQATMQDAEAARQIVEGRLGDRRKGAVCDVFIQHPDLAGTLHWKDRFLDLLTELGYPTPEGRRVTNIAQALDFLYSPDHAGHRYILKCLTLDDLARDDFTLLPLPTRDATLNHLHKMPTPMSTHTPFLLQQFLRGPEYCCHVAARKGKVTAFVACRSNEMLMRYVDVTTLTAEEANMGRRMEQWVQEFLKRWKAKLDAEGGIESYERELTGHFSFDFIWDERDETLYALECNVRAHTAICLFSTDTPVLANSYLNTVNPPLSRPPPQSAPVSWITHALPLATFRFLLRLPPINLIPPRTWGTLHPGLVPLASKPRRHTPYDPTASPTWSDTPISVLAKFTVGTFLPSWIVTAFRGAVTQTKHLHVEENLVHGVGGGFGFGEKDAYWSWTDPVPFLIEAHVTFANGWKASDTELLLPTHCEQEEGMSPLCRVEHMDFYGGHYHGANTSTTTIQELGRNFYN